MAYKKSSLPLWGYLLALGAALVAGYKYLWPMVKPLPKGVVTAGMPVVNGVVKMAAPTLAVGEPVPDVISTAAPLAHYVEPLPLPSSQGIRSAPVVMDEMMPE
ncbi:hypothetical protein F0P96_04435 [Hymenobacter busanensis]|uniref:Uncharacterized protein n=1 Tax=Hymenobacter busanensis TaxID=2607656 RepID=A0A7L4ZU73_9BACT|nr:hypothetical protein [Hymenobacter busanensis]KAA9339870.1 hypothetical protein F0P96_04435 [Hymenobacter busanensis]QHJ06375.1 hypothetical protein GUY19_03300 [Hymenobacter busanensis]